MLRLVFGQNDPTADTWQDNGGNVETNSRPIVSNTGGNSSFTVQRTDGTFFNMVAGTAAVYFFMEKLKDLLSLQVLTSTIIPLIFLIQ